MAKDTFVAEVTFKTRMSNSICTYSFRFETKEEFSKLFKIFKISILVNLQSNMIFLSKY